MDDYPVDSHAAGDSSRISRDDAAPVSRVDSESSVSRSRLEARADDRLPSQLSSAPSQLEGFPLIPQANQREGDRSSNVARNMAVPSLTNRPASESDQKTIISKSPPDAAAHLSRAGVQDLGRILVGEQLGHYILEEFVGGGGMGAVFRATDIELGRSVALKVVSGVHNDDETLRRFKNEAQSAARLDHHNIARVYYVGEDKGWHYIVFEFIRGVNIRDLVEHRGALPLDEAVYYTLQVAEALEHASQRDVVHRDIKPSNVLVMQDGKVKLVDMGLARLHQVESPADELTASGVTLGTFDYISPEQARDPRSADVRSDLYSLGCTLYYMLTGSPPFPEGTVLQKLFSHSLDAPPDPRDARPELPVDMTEIVHKLLAKNPQDRYQTPGELIQRLLRLADELPLSLASRPAITYTKSETSPLARIEYHLPWLVPTALLVLVVLLLESRSTREPIRVTPPNLPSRFVRSAPSAQSAALDRDSSQSADPQFATTESIETGDVRGEVAITAAETRGDERAGTAAGRPPDGSMGMAVGAIDRGETSFDSSAPIPTETGLSPLPVSSDRWSGLFGPDAKSFVVQPPLIAGDLSGPDASAVSPQPGPLLQPDSGRGPESAPPRVPVAPRRIIVGLDVGDPPADALVASSLATAVQRAAENATVDQIELRFNDEMLETPFPIVTKTPLLIRAAPGYRPVVRFQPELAGYGTTRRILELSGSKTVWQDVHFRLQLPTEPSEGWALFGLRDVDGVEFNRCTMTIQNMDENGIEWPHGAVFFQFDAPQTSGRMDMGMDMDGGDAGMNPMPTPREPPELTLVDCAIRGQASLIRADIAFPLSVHWRQGLLACNERFFQFGGAADASAWDAQVHIELDKVTAIVEEGFGLVALDGRGPLLIDLELILHDCIVAMNHDAPFLEHRGTGAVDRVERSLVLRGERNYYPVRDPPMTPFLPRSPHRVRWRIATAGGDRLEFLFGDHDRNWYQEVGAEYAVQWKNPLPPGVPFHRYSTQGYAINARGFQESPFAGFNSEEVPSFPEATQPAPLLPLDDRFLTLP